MLSELYGNTNGDYGHELAAIGHAHIDTAWLWPLAETYRKCVRTFSSQTTYMRDYPDFRFACSQAQQYAWVKERNPDLYARMQACFERGQLVPVGGTWVEPDCNIPSGESLVRQFLLGQSFFRREFGRRCREFWNPDVFGYNGQLPQIMRGAGIDWFLTQKLSWNAFNKPEYHTFLWQGIDGSRVLTHFPPADTYNGEATVAELRGSVARLQGPRQVAHELPAVRIRRRRRRPDEADARDARRGRATCRGFRVRASARREEFFTALEAESSDFPVLVGELYFEYHRGTYTSQAATKLANRRSEFLLHDVELLATLAHRRGGHGYPREEITGVWERSASTSSTTSSPARRSRRSTRTRHATMRRSRATASRCVTQRWPRWRKTVPSSCP